MSNLTKEQITEYCDSKRDQFECNEEFEIFKNYFVKKQAEGRLFYFNKFIALNERIIKARGGDLELRSNPLTDDVWKSMMIDIGIGEEFLGNFKKVKSVKEFLETENGTNDLILHLHENIFDKQNELNLPEYKLNDSKTYKAYKKLKELKSSGRKPKGIIKSKSPQQRGGVFGGITKGKVKKAVKKTKETAYLHSLGIGGRYERLQGANLYELIYHVFEMPYQQGIVYPVHPESFKDYEACLLMLQYPPTTMSKYRKGLMIFCFI